jgi:thiosulfate/3-mercaptopyruvate sulfurtransferase
MQALVDTAWLAAQLEGAHSAATSGGSAGSGAAPPIVVDLRWYLDPARRGRDAFRAGHIPGAVFVDLDAELSAPGGGRGRPAGRHPWPNEQQFAAAMGRAGIGLDTRVVVYDDASGSVAARLWYLLRAHGHEQVAVLDGGLPKWQAEGRPLSRDEPTPTPVVFGGRLLPGYVIGKAEMVATHRGRLVLDARVGERYRGESEPIDPRPGHVPGARNAPWTLNLTTDPVPVFLPPDALRRRYAALVGDAAEPVVYCGSGVTACHDLLALHLAGRSGRLYAGSWSEWCADPSLPVATGEE